MAVLLEAQNGIQVPKEYLIIIPQASSKSYARLFKELSITGKATLKNSSKDWDVVLLSQLKLSKNQISKSADNNPPVKKTILSVVPMQIAFFSDLFGSGNIHHIEQKFHFCLLTLQKKASWAGNRKPGTFPRTRQEEHESHEKPST